MSDELEPLDVKTQSLLSALPSQVLPAALKSKLWSRVEASAMALAPVAAPQTASVAPATKVAVAGAASKLVVPAVIAALVTGAVGGIAVDRSLRTPEEKVVTRYVDVPRAVEAVPAPVLPPEPVQVAPVPAPAPRPKPRAVAMTSGEERNLVELARTALLKREPAGALGAVAEHRKKFPKGQFAEELDALEVQALAQAGRADDAAVAAKKFLARYPHSVFEDSVTATLK